MHLITGKKGEVHVKSENTGFLNSRFCGKGCFVFEHGNDFEALKISDNSIQVRSGQGMMYGRHFEIEDGTTETLNLDTVAVGYVRADLIVVRYEKGSNGIESATLTVIKGEASQGGRPQTPSYNDGDILDGDTLVDFPLYLVYVTSGGIDIIEQQFNIVDFDLAQLQSDIADALENVEETLEDLSDELELVEYKPNVFYGSTDPFDASSIPTGGEIIKVGDLYYKIDGVENKMWYCSVVGKAGQGTVIVNIEWTEIAMKSEVNKKIDRNVAIKAFFGQSEPSPARASYSGLMSGDIYFEGTTSRLGGTIRKVYVAHISDNNEDLVFWRELTTNLSDIWNSYYTKTATNTLLSDKLDREDGIKIFYGTTEPTQASLNGSKSGDIYLRLNGNDRDVSQVVGMWIVSVYPSSGTYYWQKIPLGDYYTKTETNNLLNAKQDALTEGNNIEIDANNVISYQESEWELLKTVEATEDNPLGEIVWQSSDLVNGTYDDIMVKATNVQGNTLGNYAFQCKTTANQYNSGLFGVLLANGVSPTVARNFFTKIERLNGITEFEITSWYIDNYLNKEQSAIYTAPDLVADNPSHKLYYIRFYFSSNNTIKSGTFKIYGRKRIYGTTAQTLNSPLNLNREGITLDGTLPDELEGGLLKNVETDVLDTELNKIDDSEVEKDVSEIDNSETKEEIEPEKVEKIDKK